MPNSLNNDLPKRLREVADEFDALCANHGLQYTIESDTHNEQGYLIHGDTEKADSVREYMERFLNDRWIAMEVEPNKHGSYFKFTIQPLYEYSDEVEYKDVMKLAEANAVALESVSDYDDLLIALHLDRWIAPIVVNDDMTVIEGLDVLKALVEIGGIHGNGMAPTIRENQYKFPSSRLRRAQAPFSGSSNKPAKTFGGVSTESQYKNSGEALAHATSPRDGSSNEPALTLGGNPVKKKGKKRKKVAAEDIGIEYTLIKPLLAHDNTTIIPKGATVVIVDDDPELPDVKLEDGRIVNVDMEDLKSCIKEDVFDRIDRILNENMVAIALPDVLGAVGGPEEFETANGNMEADFEAPGGEEPEMFTHDSLLKISMKLDDAIGPHDPHHREGSMVDTLNKLWAGELVAILQYEFFYVMAPSLHMAALQEVFKEHQNAEWEHARMLSQRISELGGAPVIDLCDLSELAPHGTETVTDAAGMVAILQYQEQIAVESYRAAIKQASDDPATRNMLEQILRDEEEHLSDMESMIG